LAKNEILGLVGESGCGKTTLARCIVGLLEPTNGEIRFKGADIAKTANKRSVSTRKAMQIVFQNPDMSLNPRHTVAQMTGRPLQLFKLAHRKELRQRVLDLLEMVRLDATYLDRYPAELSGGEKQRVAIARALASDPSMMICDEAVSSLDVSVQASIINLLVELQQQRGASVLFISHDLGVVQYIADRIAVMYLGQFVDVGTVEQIFMPPYHPYTEALLSAIPVPDPLIRQEQVRLEGPVPSLADPFPGCLFHTRCPRTIGEVCKTAEPSWQDAGDGHLIRCHIRLEELRRMPSVMSRLTVQAPKTPRMANP
jgi:peptide/nickel transport system ATP-binding protein